ncbi:MAG: hypothetical protein CHACPFDD_02456 [Phycisphaerae bacterium]|nr:hypothetical protein [Phycisphaerae bacterium]
MRKRTVAGQLVRLETGTVPIMSTNVGETCAMLMFGAPSVALPVVSATSTVTSAARTQQSSSTVANSVTSPSQPASTVSPPAWQRIVGGASSQPLTTSKNACEPMRLPLPSNELPVQIAAPRQPPPATPLYSPMRVVGVAEPQSKRQPAPMSGSNARSLSWKSDEKLPAPSVLTVAKTSRKKCPAPLVAPERLS